MRQDGSITERKDGRFMVRLTIDGKRKTVGYTRTKAEARALLREKRRERNAGRLVAGSSQTVAQWLKYWIEGVKRPMLAENSWHQYDIFAGAVVRQIGTIPLAKVTTQDIRTCYAALAEHYAPSSMRTLQNIIKQAFRQAMIEGEIDRNPADLVDAPKVERRPGNVMTPAEMRRVIEETQGERFHALWTLLLTTGMRRGEAFALLWEFVGDDYLRVEHTIAYAYGKPPRLGPPKTESSRREIPLPEITVDALRAQKQTQPPGTRLVFPGAKGGIVAAGSVYRAWTHTLARLGLRHYSLHDIRHSVITLLTTANERPQSVQTFVGHSDVDTTLRYYSHLRPDARGVSDHIMQILDIAHNEVK